MATAVTVTAQNYVLEEDKGLPESQRTTFLLKPLSARQASAIQDKVKSSGRTETARLKNEDTGEMEELVIPIPDNLQEIILEKCVCGLIGWVNFKDTNGKDVPFLKDMEQNLSRLTRLHRLELSIQIDMLTNPTRGLEKNSDSQQSGSPQKTETTKASEK